MMGHTRGTAALVLSLCACAATDSGAECDTKFRDRGVADFFFDEECVANMHSHKYDCPTSTVNDFVREFIVPLRSDWVVGSFVMMVLSLMLMPILIGMLVRMLDNSAREPSSAQWAAGKWQCAAPRNAWVSVRQAQLITGSAERALAR